MPSNVDLNVRDDLLAQTTLVLFQISQLFGHEDLFLSGLIDRRDRQTVGRRRGRNARRQLFAHVRIRHLSTRWRDARRGTVVTSLAVRQLVVLLDHRRREDSRDVRVTCREDVGGFESGRRRLTTHTILRGI